MRWAKQAGFDLPNTNNNINNNINNNNNIVDSLEECTRGGGAGVGDGVLAEGDGGVAEEGRLNWPVEEGKVMR